MGNYTNYGLQVKLGNNKWVTYCGIFDVNSLLQACHKVSSWDAPRDNKHGRYYGGYRVANVVTGHSSHVDFTEV